MTNGHPQALWPDLPSYPEALLLLDQQGCVTFLNDACARLLGLSASAAIGQCITSLLSLPDTASWQQAGSGTLYAQVRQGLPDSQRVQLTIFPRFEHEQWVGTGILIDPSVLPAPGPTQRSPAHEEQLDIIFRSVADVIFVLHIEGAQQYRFHFVNQAFLDVTGLATDQVVGRLVQEVIPPPSLDIVLHHYAVAQQTCQRQTWVEVTDYPTGQLVGEVSVTPVLDDAGQCYQLVGIVHDLTTQKRIEAALRASNERFMYALKATADALYDWDVQANRRFWGEGFEAIFGYSAEAIPVHLAQWAELVHPDDAPHTVDDLQRTVAQVERTHWQQEYRFRRANGSWATVVDRGYLIRDAQGTALRMIGAMQDITERREAEEQQRRMAQELFRQNADLQQFAYIVSHNLRAPLANARGYAALLPLLAQDAEASRTSLHHLQASLQQLDAVVIDVDAVLSLRNPLAANPHELVSVANVYEQVRQALESDLAASGGILESNIPLDLQVLGNRAYVYSILLNLLTNAIKYRSDQRPLQVVVTAAQSTATQVLIRVADNGSGFDQERAGADVFQLYKRFHTQPGGRGMGLFLVKAHTDALGGRVEVSSRLDEGTCFTLYLPSPSHDHVSN